MKCKSVMFREDVRMPGGSGYSSGYQDGKPEGLTIDADEQRRIVILRCEGQERRVPFEMVRSYDPATVEAAKGKGKGAEMAT